LFVVLPADVCGLLQLALLDMNPLLKALSKNGPLSIIRPRNSTIAISPLTQPRWPEWVSPMTPEAACHFSGGTQAHHPIIQTLRAILELPEDQIDLAKAKLTIDHMIDPAIDVDAWLRQLDGMADEIRRVWRLHNAPWDRSPKWSQFRSTRRQRGWWLDRA
jgi:hypothetical protein